MTTLFGPLTSSLDLQKLLGPSILEALQKLWYLLHKHRITGCLVGGCVRDMTLGIQPHDLDMAIDFPPEALINAFEQEDVKLIPTGIKHGTVTVVLKGIHFELTSLRQDLETNGRHATVVFTKDWIQDALRRDFTLNALYCDSQGNIYDPTGLGLSDAHRGIVRFIGDPSQRIQEDYLRILRFFRFSMRFSKNQILHNESLRACQEHRESLQKISKERRSSELLKILAYTPNTWILKELQVNGILSLLHPAFQYCDTLQKMDTSECVGDKELLGLYILLQDNIQDCLDKNHPYYIRNYLSLSNQQISHLKLLHQVLTSRDLTKEHLLYYFQPEILLMLASMAPELLTQEEITTFKKPVFPLTGYQLKELGLSGPILGQIFHETESWWVGQRFSPTQEACLSYVKEKQL